ncbi:MAG: prepilin-type N-terminal cleavage/methylation domain-containing protein [Patescibacteria group bacterium]
MKRSGFTIIELLLAIGIMATVVGSASVFFVILTESRIKQETIVEIEDLGNGLVTTIGQAIRNADSVTTPALGASGSSLVLAYADSAKNPTTFQTISDRIRITEGVTAAIELVPDHVSSTNVTFTNLSSPATAGTIRFQFTLSSINLSGRQPYSYSQTFFGSATVRKRP